jgi:hypothetical protein
VCIHINWIWRLTFFFFFIIEIRIHRSIPCTATDLRDARRLLAHGWLGCAALLSRVAGPLSHAGPAVRSRVLAAVLARWKTPATAAEDASPVAVTVAGAVPQSVRALARRTAVALCAPRLSACYISSSDAAVRILAGLVAVASGTMRPRAAKQGTGADR